MKPRNALDAMVGAAAAPGTERADKAGPLGFLGEALSVFGLGGAAARRPGETGRPNEAGDEGGLGGRLGDWARQAQEAMGRNPGLTAGGLLAGAGLLLGSGRARGLLGGAAGLGGLALIGALAYKAFRRNQEQDADAPPSAAAAAPFDPARATDADARLFARAMVAAVAADGHVDDKERTRVGNGLRDAGLDSETATWLEREFIHPASPEALAAEAFTPAKAAQVYAAARLAIEPDTGAEQDFLDRLAAALNLEPKLRGEIDRGAGDLKTAV